MMIPHAIERLLESVRRTADGAPLAVFDCDGTLVKGDIGEAMFYHQIRHFLFRESPAEIWTDYPERSELGRLFDLLARLDPFERQREDRMVRFANRLLSWYHEQLARGETRKACADIVRLFAGFRPEELEEIGTTVFNEETASDIGDRPVGTHRVPRGIRFIHETAILLERVRSSGFDVMVISGSNRWSVGPVAVKLGIPTERILGIDLAVRFGSCSADVVTPVPVREGKVEALEALRLPRPSIVVSDSIYDLPLFEYSSGLKVLVQSNSQSDGFFKHRGTEPDESWVLIDRPSLVPVGEI